MAICSLSNSGSVQESCFMLIAVAASPRRYSVVIDVQVFHFCRSLLYEFLIRPTSEAYSSLGL
jgi:hypothetical protein